MIFNQRVELTVFIPIGMNRKTRRKGKLSRSESVMCPQIEVTEIISHVIIDKPFVN